MMNHHGKNGAEDPKVKVSSLIQRGNDLVAACRRDREELEASGLKWDDVEELASLVNECSSAEALWRLALENSAAERKELKAYADTCRTFRNSLVKKIRAANELSPGGLLMPRFRKKSSSAELVQDLHDVHVLCRVYAERSDGKTPFEGNPGLKALEHSRKLSLLCASTVLNREKSEALKLRRNILYNRMYSLIQTICAPGRQVFRNDPRKRDYYSGKPHRSKCVPLLIPTATPK
jgi:hypothetical protein